MESQINELSPTLIEVTVQVPWDRVQKDLQAGYRELSKHAKVRGFRPGKVPAHMVKKLFGKQVKAEVRSSLVEAGLLHAFQQHELAVVAEPSVDPGAIDDGKPFEFKATVEVRPKLDKVDLSKLVVYQKPVDIPNEEVEAEVQSLRKQHADLREPEPMRPAKKGDEVTADYQVEIDGKINEEMGATDRTIDLSDDSLLKEMAEGLMGMSPGEEKDIEVPFEDDHPNPELAGKTVIFKVKVTSLRERILPEEDDDFAQDCGEFETLLELRADIRKRLTEQAEEKAQASVKEQIIDKLIETNEIPVPPSLVKQQQQQMMYEMAAFMQMMGQQLGPGDLEGMEGRALRRVQAGLVLGAVARLENIEVGEEQIQEKLQEIAERTGKHIAKVKVEHASGEKRDRLENEVLEEKLMAFLRSKATIKEEDPPEPKKASKEQEKEKEEA